MKPIHVELSDEVDARPGAVYAVFADYNSAHPAVLPESTFKGLKVQKGGVGSGTVVEVHMSMMGVEKDYCFSVSEPVPGRVLVETDPNGGVVNTFTIDPLDDGRRSRVTIATDIRPSTGIMGWIERLVVPPMIRRVYRQEMRKLAEHVRARV